MDRIIYYCILGFSRLPFRILYIISDLSFVFNYYIIRYRKGVVMSNIANSFPEKSELEQKKIVKKFYRNLSDYLVESIKGLTISKEELNKRMLFSNIEEINSTKERNVTLLSGHVFNFEWYVSLMLKVDYEGFHYIYKPLRSKFMNDKVNHLRRKFDAEGIPAKLTLRKVVKIPNDGKHMFYFLSDQSPKKENVKHSLRFLNQETAVYRGYEDIVNKYNQIPVYADTVKIKRGYYKTTFRKIKPEDGVKFCENELVSAFYEHLTKTIQRNPDNWLWSHKRWKFKKGTDF
ncbi:MAG: lysophospholipid acyltransferase family protein [Flavobacteriales bacterium]